jgi:GTP1/Obg family GTP-binding protein
MSDPLSISAALIGFISAAIPSVKTSAEILGDFRHASAEIDALVRTCRDLTEVLTSLENLQQSVSRLPATAVAKTGISEAYLKSCTSALKDLGDVAKFLQTQMASKTFGKQLAKLKWSLNKKRKVMQCNDRIQHHKSTLILALSVFQR